MTSTRKIFSKGLWLIIIAFSGYYLYRAILFRFYKEGLGPGFWDKQFLYVFHLATAIAPLVLGPIQFWNGFRNKYVHWHRRLGKLYIFGSLLGGLSALILGITIPYEGSIIPLILLSLLWLFMTSAAWLAILRKNIKAHRLFMIRSYTLALTFIVLRILDDLVFRHNFFFFIENEDTKATSTEWLSWVLPLLVVECIISWLPSLKKKQAR